MFISNKGICNNNIFLNMFVMDKLWLFYVINVAIFFIYFPTIFFLYNKAINILLILYSRDLKKYVLAVVSDFK